MGSSVFPAAASGPSLAEITTAITTNAAPASVTNSSITTAGNSAGWGATPNNWTLIGSATPNGSTNAITFSGLSGYKTYRMLIGYTTPGGGNEVGFRVNGDSGSNYTWRGIGFNSASTQAQGTSAQTSYKFQTYVGGTLNWLNAFIQIENCTNSGAKFISSESYASGSSYDSFNQSTGHWLGTGTVTSLSISNLNGTGLLGGGYPVYLYGAN